MENQAHSKQCKKCIRETDLKRPFGRVFLACLLLGALIMGRSFFIPDNGNDRLYLFLWGLGFWVLAQVSRYTLPPVCSVCNTPVEIGVDLEDEA